MLSALRLCGWRFDNGYMELFNVDQTFTFAFWTKERKIFKYGIFPNFVACFISAYWAADELCFLHIVHSELRSFFFLSRYFRMSLLRIGTPTPIKSTTAKIVKSIPSPHISFFFIIRMDKMIETAYIATIEKTARKTRSIGEDSTIEIIEFPIAGIFERRSKVTKKPATGIYINTRPLIEPYL